MESEGMGRDEVCATISSLPGQLSHEDVEDFFSLAHYYASRTPQSFRKVLSSLTTHYVILTSFSQDYHSLMFGSGRSGTALASNVSHALCLPISLQEVLDSNITDTTIEVYMNIHIPVQWNQCTIHGVLRRDPHIFTT